jgi:hypothetical protein
MAEPADRPITRDDIEAKLRSLKGEVDERADSAKSSAVPIAIGAAVLLLLLAFLLGKRVGRRKSTVVEIRRV